ncbi:putative carboxylesterase [Tirmania nivea]|nr:putative carboxylesterase [Tirmania nivea]
MVMFLSRALLSLSLFLSATLAKPAPPIPTVNAPFGTIIGREGSLDSTVHEYLGIPYAEPPTGPLRFGPPVRLPNQKTQIIAKAFGLPCPSQPGVAPTNTPFNFTAPEGEDCLSINIWTKPGRDNAPVLVWIYGGAFIFGTSNGILYDGTHFAANNEAVIVSLNYRTNVFGFPNSPAVSTENLGILDQRLALEWVRDNIESFGGDPSRITLFGHSAGGTSVEIHSYAWAQDPIVNGYIPQSGTVGLVPLIGGGDNYYRWGNLTEKVGCATAGTEKDKLKCMQALPWEKIVDGMRALDSCNSVWGYFGPRVDGKVILSAEEYKMRAENGLFAQLPMLIGNTDAEFGSASGLRPNCSESVQNPKGLTPEQLAEVVSAIAFSCPAKEAASARAQHKVPIWRYRYFGSFNFNTTFDFPIGASHGAELPVVLGAALYIGDPPARERAVIKWIQGAWTTFATNPFTGLSSAPLKLPLYKPDTRSPTLIRLAYKDEVAPSMTYPLEYDWICYAIDAMPTRLRRGVERTRRGVDIQTALQEMTAEELTEIVRWIGKASGDRLLRPAL